MIGAPVVIERTAAWLLEPLRAKRPLLFGVVVLGGRCSFAWMMAAEVVCLKLIHLHRLERYVIMKIPSPVFPLAVLLAGISVFDRLGRGDWGGVQGSRGRLTVALVHLTLQLS